MQGADLSTQTACLGINAERTEQVCLEAGTGIAKVPYHAAQHGCQHADLLCEASNAPVCIAVLQQGMPTSGSCR